MPGEVAADRETGLQFQEFGCHLSHLVGGQRVRSDRGETHQTAPCARCSWSHCRFPWPRLVRCSALFSVLGARWRPCAAV